MGNPLLLFEVALAVGMIGLLLMAVPGFGRHGAHGHAGSHGHGLGGHHGGHGAAPHTGAHGVGHSAAASHGHAAGAHANGHAAGGNGAHAAGYGTGASAHGHAHGHHSEPAREGTAPAPSVPHLGIPSPRTVFSWLVGFGAAGIVLTPWLPVPATYAVSVGAAWSLEKFILYPLWRSLFAFASRPSEALEGTLFHTATAVTNFDATGSGLVQLTIDGQVVQLLARLRPEDRQQPLAVRRGDRVRVESVNAAANSCIVARDAEVTI